MEVHGLRSRAKPQPSFLIFTCWRLSLERRQRDDGKQGEHAMDHKLRVPLLAWKGGAVYVEDCPPVRISSQGETEQEAIENLKEQIGLYFEDAPEVVVPPYEDTHARDLEVPLAS